MVLFGKRYHRHLQQVHKPLRDLEDVDLVWTYLCDAKDCKSMFKSKDMWIRHLKSHSGSNGVSTCQICEKPFADSENLDKHVELVHVEGAVIGKTVWDCNYCAATFEDENEFKKHEEVHVVDLTIRMTGTEQT